MIYHPPLPFWIVYLITYYGKLHGISDRKLGWQEKFFDFNNNCQIPDGKSMTLVTLPRCGLMLMWLLLTAGTFDTICPWTIQHEQWFSSRRVNFPSTGLQYCLSPCVCEAGGMEAGVNIWLFVIIYIWVKFDIPRKGSWWAPIWPLAATAPLAA